MCPTFHVGLQVAIKLFPRTSQNEQRVMQQEIQILEHAARSCARTCRMYGTCAKERYFCIVMKLYEEALSGLLSRSPGELAGLQPESGMGQPWV